MTVVRVNGTGDWRLPLRLLKRGLKEVLAAQGISRGEVSVTYLDDDAIRALNRDYLKRDRPTDVLAFALHRPGEEVLGDVYVGFDQARRQAEEHGVELDEELLRLAIHGVLHVLGHDHPDGKGRECCPMFLLQEELLRRVVRPG